jgi:hypothetical protein
MPTLDDNPLNEVGGDDIQDGSSDEFVDALQHTPDLSSVSRQDLMAVRLSPIYVDHARTKSWFHIVDLPDGEGIPA